MFEAMEISEYTGYGRSGRRDWYYVLCEDPQTDNSPRLNKPGIAFAVAPLSKRDDEGFYPCCFVSFRSTFSGGWFDESTGCLGRSVRFNPATEEFRFGPPVEKRDAVRPIDFDFYVSASHGSVADLKRLVALGANPDAPIFNDINDDLYAIHKAALNPDLEVLKYIISLGVNPCRVDFWWRQPLSFAVRKNSLEMVKFLVEKGNDPCLEDMDGASVLSESALNPDIRVVEYLLSKGAKIDGCADDRTELGYALTDGTIERMKFFMDRGADLTTAMLCKAPWAPLENLRFALESGFDPNTFDDGEYGDGHREKIIDWLDPKRQALFMEFGGTIHWKDAEKWNTEACAEEVDS